MDFKFDPMIAARKDRNAKIFQETLQICRDGGYTAPNGRFVGLPAKSQVLSASALYVNPPDVRHVPVVSETIIDAVNADCIVVARDLVEKGFRPALLNMANRHTPGGGVIYGARAQEESLFRQSNLCVSLYQYSDDGYHAGLVDVPMAKCRYPMDRNLGGAYSGRVTFFRTGQRDGDKLVDNPFECAVVSVAAINHPELDMSNRLVSWAVEATEKKIRTILRIALGHGHDAIVLGALGCGAFHNPPEHIAEIFDLVLHEEEFANKFKVVRFAIIEDHNSGNSNYEPFARRFNRPASAASPQAMVNAMRILAEKMHNRDTKPRKYTGAPYITHPANVVAKLKEWGYSEDDWDGAVVLSVAWGHDLLEDTQVTPDEIAEAAKPMSERVIKGIECLTFIPMNGVSKDSYIKSIALHAPSEFLVVKIADRLCNVLDFLASGDPWAKDYLRLGEPLFARIDECHGACQIKATLNSVRKMVAEFKEQ